MIERLRSSRRLQIEVALAGLALWQLKRELNKREGAIEPPYSEEIGGKVVYVWPDSFDEYKNPRGIEVGHRDENGNYTGVRAALDDELKVESIASESKKKSLKSLKKLINTKAEELQRKLH